MDEIVKYAELTGREPRELFKLGVAEWDAIYNGHARNASSYGRAADVDQESADRAELERRRELAALACRMEAERRPTARIKQ